MDLNTTILWEFLKDLIHLSPASPMCPGTRTREGAGVSPSANLTSSEQMALTVEMD